MALVFKSLPRVLVTFVHHLLDKSFYTLFIEACCAPLVKAGIIILLLRVFDRWEKYESKIRIKICTRILQTLKHVCTISMISFLFLSHFITTYYSIIHMNYVLFINGLFCILEAGRRIVATKKHIQILYRFCMTCPDEDIYDRLVTKVSSVICHSLNNRSMPVPSKNPATFDLSNIISGKHKHSFILKLHYPHELLLQACQT